MMAEEGFDPTEVGNCIEHPYPLRDQQKEAVDKILKKKKGQMAWATGTGKTTIAWEMINQLGCPRTLVVVPLLTLIDQHSEDLQERIKGDFKVGTYSSEKHDLQRITITTYQSLVPHTEIMEGFDVIVLDEVHHMTGPATFEEIWDDIMEKEYVLGLSATPPSKEKTEEGGKIRRDLPVLDRLKVPKAETHEYVASQEIHPLPIELTWDEQVKYEDASDLINNAGSQLGTKNPRKIGQMLKGDASDWKKKYAKQYFKGVNDRKDVLAMAKNKDNKVLDICRNHPDEKIMLFTSRKDPLEDITEYLNEAGCKAEFITGDTSQKDRIRLLEEWGDEFQVLGSIKVLAEGYDVPECGVAIFVSSGSGTRVVTQKIGRVIRPQEDKTADIYVIYADNTKEEKLLSKVKEVTGAPVEEPGLETIEEETGAEEVDVLDKWKDVSEEEATQGVEEGALEEEEEELQEEEVQDLMDKWADVGEKDTEEITREKKAVKEFSVGDKVQYFGRPVKVIDVKYDYDDETYLYNLQGLEDTDFIRKNISQHLLEDLKGREENWDHIREESKLMD